LKRHLDASSMTTATRRHRPCLEALEDRHLPSTVFGLTPSNSLFAFDTGNPAALTAATPITGLPSGETLQALDLRPATGQLLALGSANGGHLYALDPATAADHPRGSRTQPAPLTVAGSFTESTLIENRGSKKKRIEDRPLATPDPRSSILVLRHGGGGPTP